MSEKNKAMTQRFNDVENSPMVDWEVYEITE